MTGQSFDLIPFLISLLSASVRLAVPIMLPALGEVYAERSGIINLGTEGVMIMAALGGMVGAYFFKSIWNW